MSVGSNIKRRRFELRMSQQELADAMGYSTRSTIAKIESGENDVSQKKLQKFADALDTTVEALISGYAVPAPAAAEPAVTDRNRPRGAVVILAGGKAGRNRQNIPTQFINVHGRPILVYAMDAYQTHPSIDDIYVVCLKGWENIVQAYAEEYGITKLRGLIPAGSCGTASLQNALNHIRGGYGVNDILMVPPARWCGPRPSPVCCRYAPIGAAPPPATRCGSTCSSPPATAPPSTSTATPSSPCSRRRPTAFRWSTRCFSRRKSCSTTSPRAV